MVNRTVTFQSYDDGYTPTGSFSIFGMNFTLEECLFLLRLYPKTNGLLQVALKPMIGLIEVATGPQVAFQESERKYKTVTAASKRYDFRPEAVDQHTKTIELCQKKGWDPKNQALYIKAAKEVLDR